MDEKTLVRAAQGGDIEDLRRLFEDNKRRIHALGYQYTGNPQDAEDIFQETFIKAFRSIGRFRPGPETTFSAWVYRIGINCSIDHLRRVRRRGEVGQSEAGMAGLKADPRTSNPEIDRGRAEVSARVEEVLATLPPRQRMVFVLRHYQEMKVREIAASLGCSEGSVKTQLFRAMDAFKKRFRNLLPEKNYEMQKI